MEYLKECNREGVRIVFASHQREDVGALADKVVMMSADGYVSVSGDEFREAHGLAPERPASHRNVRPRI